MLRGHSTPSDVPVGQRTVGCQGRLLLPLPSELPVPTFTRQRVRGYCQVRGYTSAQGRPHVWHRQLPAPVYTRNVRRMWYPGCRPHQEVLFWRGQVVTPRPVSNLLPYELLYLSGRVTNGVHEFHLFIVYELVWENPFEFMLNCFQQMPALANVLQFLWFVVSLTWFVRTVFHITVIRLAEFVRSKRTRTNCS